MSHKTPAARGQSFADEPDEPPSVLRRSVAMYDSPWESGDHDGTYYGAAGASDLSGFELDTLTRISDTASLWSTTPSQEDNWPPPPSEFIFHHELASLPCQNHFLLTQPHIHPGQHYPNMVPGTTAQNLSGLYSRDPGALSADVMHHQLATDSGSSISHPALDKGYPEIDECEDSCSEADCCGPCKSIPCDAEDCEQEDCTPCDDDKCFWGSIHDPQYGDVPPTEGPWSQLDPAFTQYPCVEACPQGGMHHPGQQQPCSHLPGEHNAIAVLHGMQRGGPSCDPWDPVVSAPPIETPPLCPDDGGFEMTPKAEPLKLDAQNVEPFLVCQWLIDHGDNKPVPCNCTFSTPKELHSHLVERHTPDFNGKTGFNCLWDGCFRGKDQTFASRHKLHRHLPSHSRCKSEIRPR